VVYEGLIQRYVPLFGHSLWHLFVLEWNAFEPWALKQLTTKIQNETDEKADIGRRLSHTVSSPQASHVMDTSAATNDAMTCRNPSIFNPFDTWAWTKDPVAMCRSVHQRCLVKTNDLSIVTSVPATNIQSIHDNDSSTMDIATWIGQSTLHMPVAALRYLQSMIDRTKVSLATANGLTQFEACMEPFVAALPTPDMLATQTKCG
jgi:hypothetical protein